MFPGLRRLWNSITESFSAFINHPCTGAWACLLVPVTFGYISVSLGMDANYDIFNYHLYNPFAFLNGKLAIDLAPAGMQSYFNPMLDLPYYWATQHLPPRLVGFTLGFMHGLNFVLLLGIARQAFPDRTDTDRYRVPLLLAAAGCISSNFLCELGNAMGDNMTALFELGGLLILLSGWYSLQAWSSRSVLVVMAAGALAGLGVGLKLTNAVYALALCFGFLVLHMHWTVRLRLALLFGVGALLGFAVTGGYWIAEMWHLYGNPLYPQFAALFPNPLTRSIGIADTRWMPRGLLETLAWPFLFTLNPLRVNQLRVFQFIWPLLYVLFLAWGVKSLWQHLHRRTGPALDTRQSYILAFVGIGFVLWMKLFSIYRYLVPIELLAPIAAFVLFLHVLGPDWGRRIGAWALLVSALVVMRYGLDSWGHKPWADTMFRAEVPALKTPASTTVLVTGGKHKLPNAWLATFFPPDVSFIGLSVSFPESRAYAAEVHRMIQQRGGPVYTIVSSQPDPEHSDDVADKNEALEQKAARILAHYGFGMDMASCVQYSAYAGQWPYPYRFCRIVEWQHGRADLPPEPEDHADDD